MTIKRILMVIGALLAASLTFAEGPRFSHKEPITDREFDNVYQDIRSIRSEMSQDTIRIQDTIQSGATFYVSSGTVVILNGSTATFTGQLIGRGTQTNSSACQFCIGEYISSGTAASTNTGATGVFFDGPAISLTPGDWDVTASASFIRNGATFSSTLLIIGFSVTSGNSSSGLAFGTGTRADFNTTVPTTFTTVPMSLPPKRVSLAAQTTYYLKLAADAYAPGQPQYQGIISARRVR